MKIISFLFTRSKFFLHKSLTKFRNPFTKKSSSNDSPDSSSQLQVEKVSTSSNHDIKLYRIGGMIDEGYIPCVQEYCLLKRKWTH